MQPVFRVAIVLLQGHEPWLGRRLCRPDEARLSRERQTSYRSQRISAYVAAPRFLASSSRSRTKNSGLLHPARTVSLLSNGRDALLGDVISTGHGADSAESTDAKWIDHRIRPTSEHPSSAARCHHSECGSYGVGTRRACLKHEP